MLITLKKKELSMRSLWNIDLEIDSKDAMIKCLMRETYIFFSEQIDSKLVHFQRH